MTPTETSNTIAANPIYATSKQDLEVPTLQLIVEIVSTIFTAIAAYFAHAITLGLFLANYEAHLINLKQNIEEIKNKSALLNQSIDELVGFESTVNDMDQSEVRTGELNERISKFEKIAEKTVTSHQTQFYEAISDHKQLILYHWITLGFYSAIKGVLQNQESVLLEAQLKQLELEQQELILKGLEKTQTLNQNHLLNTQQLISERQEKLKRDAETHRPDYKKLDDERLAVNEQQVKWAFREKVCQDKVKGAQKRLEASFRHNEKYYLYLLGEAEPIIEPKFEDPKTIQGDTFKIGTAHHLRYSKCKLSIDLYNIAAEHALFQLKKMNHIEGQLIKKISLSSYIAYDLIIGGSLETDCMGSVSLHINPYLTVKDSNKTIVIDKPETDLTSIITHTDPWTPYGKPLAIYPATAKRLLERFTDEEKKLVLDKMLSGILKPRARDQLNMTFNSLSPEKKEEVKMAGELISNIGNSLIEKIDDILEKNLNVKTKSKIKQ